MTSLRGAEGECVWSILAARNIARCALVVGVAAPHPARPAAESPVDVEPAAVE